MISRQIEGVGKAIDSAVCGEDIKYKFLFWVKSSEILPESKENLPKS